MVIDFPGGTRVDAHFGNFIVQTDQPPSSSAPTPFDMFGFDRNLRRHLCAGSCRQRGLSLRFEDRAAEERTRRPGRLAVSCWTSSCPPAFRRSTTEAVIQSAQLCAVKKHLEHPPVFDIVTSPN
jgi:ribosomal protein S12 methylthiotransferase accessory factor